MITYIASEGIFTTVIDVSDNSNVRCVSYLKLKTLLACTQFSPCGCPLMQLLILLDVTSKQKQNKKTSLAK